MLKSMARMGKRGKRMWRDSLHNAARIVVFFLVEMKRVCTCWRLLMNTNIFPLKKSSKIRKAGWKKDGANKETEEQ